MLGKLEILFNALRGYALGDPVRNGEYRFLRSIARSGMTVFDVGANVGDYSRYLFTLAGGIEAHCFEPVNSTFAVLKERLGAAHGNTVHLNNCGLSNKQEERFIKIFGDLAGTNSLYERRSAYDTHPQLATFTEQPALFWTLDSYRAEERVGTIDLLKIDVEGHELRVLEGAVCALQDGSIRVIQFEYGGCFRDADATLGAVFDLLCDHGYSLYRLFPFGKFRIKKFNRKLENYLYSNWIAVGPEHEKSQRDVPE